MISLLLDLWDRCLDSLKIVKDLLSVFFIWLFPAMQKALLVITLCALFFSCIFAVKSSFEGQFLLGIYFMLGALVALVINKNL